MYSRLENKICILHHKNKIYRKKVDNQIEKFLKVDFLRILFYDHIKQIHYQKLKTLKEIKS